MRKKIRSRLVRTLRGVPGASCYRAGRPLTDAQFRNLRFRDDCLGPDGKARVFGDETERRAAWREHRERFISLTNPGMRVPAFWTCEPGVPDELRVLPSVTGYRSVEAAAQDHERIAVARRRWLLEHPEQLRAGEREVLQQLIARA